MITSWGITRDQGPSLEGNPRRDVVEHNFHRDWPEYSDPGCSLCFAESYRDITRLPSGQKKGWNYISAWDKSRNTWGGYPK